MTAAPQVPAAEAEAGVDVAVADGVLSGQLMSAAVFLAGLLANGLLETVGRPEKLPQDLFPSAPEVARDAFQLGVAAGLHAGRVSAAPRLYRDQMARTQAAFKAIGYEAMARSVGRSRRLVAPHPADGETARPGNGRCDKRTTDTGEGDRDR